MIFNEHFVEGHAFLSPSQPAWVNYSDERLAERYATTWQAAQRGTRLHALACELIDLGVKLPKNGQTLSLYVNDAISYMMSPETVLYYSPYCFGTADAISFRRKMLRIHDLKTGVHKASMTQLEVYEALFCLEYKINPRDIRSELRIYQNNEIFTEVPEPDTIFELMGKIKHFSNMLTEMEADL